MGPSHRLEIRLLGPPDVRVDGRPLRTDTRKAVALLAYLTQRETPPGRDDLVDLLWPDSDPDRGRGALRRTVSTLRAALGGRWVSADRERIRLEPEGVLLDTDVLSRSRDPGPALVRGRFLEGFWIRGAPGFDEWQDATAERYDRIVRGLLRDAVAAAIGEGDPAGAVSRAERLVALDPLDEATHRALMGAYAAAGDRTAATRQFRRLVAVLDAELGVEPLPETVELHESILDGRTVRRMPPVQPIAPAQEPEWPFVGRRREVELVRKLAARPGVVRVTGPPDSGRSRTVAVALPDAVWATAHAGEGALPHALTRSLLDACLAAGDPAALDEAAAPAGHLHGGIAAVLGPPPPVVGELGPVRLLAAVAAAVAALAGGRPVVVDDLDLADSASREAVDFLADRAALLGLTMVLVTEEPDGSSVDIGPLPASDVAALAGEAGVDVESLLDVTGGWPGPLREILTAGVPHEALSRRRTERLGSLDAVARQVLEGLAVIGPAPPGLVASVTGRDGDETAAALDRLIADRLATGGESFSLLPWVGDAVGARIGPARRTLLHSRAADALARRRDAPGVSARAWHLHEAGRREDAALAHAEAGRLAAAIHAHDVAATHLRAAIAAGHEDTGGLHRMLGDVERAAGRYRPALAAYHSAAAAGTDVDLERSIADVYRRWGRWELAEAALAAAERVADARSLPLVLADRAEVAFRAGDRSRAEDFIGRAATAAPDDPSVETRVHNVAGLVLDDPAELEAAVDAARRGRLREAEAAGLNNLALAQLRRGRAEVALGLADRALALLDQSGDRHRRAAVLGNLADIHHRLGDEGASRTHLRRAVELFAEVGIDPGEWDAEIWMLTSW